MDSNKSVSALGRPFALGMLYDARNDKLFTDFTLWDRETIEKNSTKQPHTSSTYDVTASDTIDSKSSLLDVQASLKASFLCGLVEVGGSASYLNDKKKSKKRSRVTLQYKATTEFERMTISHLEAKNMQIKDMPKKCSATHIVTGILYAANAFFVFDSEKLDDSSVQDVQVSMEAVIKKIPTADFEAKAKVKLTNEEQKLTEKFSCKFYGDFILESNPATFEEAVKTYQQLPQLLGQNEEKTVPVKVWLTPLKNLEPKAPECEGEICVGLLRKAENALESISEIEMRCNDALEEEVVKHFPPIYKKLSKFKDCCEDYTKTLKQAMEKTFPSIRAGTEDGSSLEELLDNQETSPFSLENLDKWLDNAEREINVVNFCVEIMKEAQIVANGFDLDRGILTPGVEHALCFVFTSLETDDPLMDQMADYVRSHKSNDVTPPTRDKWFFSDKVLTKMRQKATEFSNIVKGLSSSSRFRFLVAAVPNEEFQGATVYHYKDSILNTEDFSKPDIPDPTTVTDRQTLMWYHCDLSFDPDTAHISLSLSEDKKKATCGDRQKYPDHPQRFDTILQVLCREGLSDRHYWEVELSEGDSMSIAVTYKGISRKGDTLENKFGRNTRSWCVGVNEDEEYTTWHNNEEHEVKKPSPGSKRIGVFLDWRAGHLCFYKVTSDTLSIIHSFKASFTQPLYPGVWIQDSPNYVALCPAE